MTKNAYLRFEWHPEDYPDVELEFDIDEDPSCLEVIDYFKKFLIAMSFPSQTVEEKFTSNI